MISKIFLRWQDLFEGNDAVIGLEVYTRLPTQIDEEGLSLNVSLQDMAEGAAQSKACIVRQLGLGDQSVSPCDHEIGDIQGVGDSNLGPEGLFVPSHNISILDVIVDKKEVVKDFGGHGERKGP